MRFRDRLVWMAENDNGGGANGNGDGDNDNGNGDDGNGGDGGNKPPEITHEALLATVPEDDADLRETAKRLKTYPDAIRTVRDLRGKLSKAISIPGEDATDEQIAAFRKAVGVPEKAEGYEHQFPADFPDALKPEKGDTTVVDRLKAAAHKNALSPAQFTGMFNEFLALQVEIDKATSTAAEKERGDTEKALRIELSGDYDKTIQAADRIGAYFFGKDGFALLKDSGLINNLDIRKGFIKMVNAIGEESHIMADTRSEEENADLEKEYDGLLKLKYKDPDAYRKAQPRMIQIRRMLDGTAPAVGTGGRTV